MAHISTDKSSARPDRLAQLDGMRGVAVLFVIWHHFGLPIPKWLDWGPIAPSIFMMLSGYLITRSLEKMRGQVTGAGLLSFHARRLTRLLPALYHAGLGLAVGLGGVSRQHPMARWISYECAYGRHWRMGRIFVSFVVPRHAGTILPDLATHPPAACSVSPLYAHSRICRRCALPRMVFAYRGFGPLPVVHAARVVGCLRRRRIGRLGAECPRN